MPNSTMSDEQLRKIRKNVADNALRQQANIKTLLKARMKELNLTEHDIAQESGTSLATIKRFFSPGAAVQTVTLMVIVNHLKMELTVVPQK